MPDAALDRVRSHHRRPPRSEARLRIVYYTHPAFFEPALSLVRELSRRAEVHLLMELAPSAWQTAAFDLAPRALRGGLVPADEVIGDAFPPAVRAFWSGTASFHMVVHRSKQSLHPAAWYRGRQALRFARSVSADVLHVDDVDVSPRLPLALAGNRALPVVLNVHDPEPHSGETSWRKRLSRRLAYPRVSRFILHNRSQRAWFLERYHLPPSAVEVVELGVTEVLNAWRSGAGAARASGNGRPCALFVGRLSPYKGLEVFYAAATAIARAVPDVRIVVAGKPVAGYQPPPPPTLPPPASIEVRTDYVDNATLVRLLDDADVVVCPYTDATQSGVVLTANGLDVPVVATRVGGLPDYVLDGRTGLLVEPGDANGLADAVSRVLRDDGLRRRLVEGIVAEKRGRLGWGRAADRLLEIYASLRPG